MCVCVSCSDVCFAFVCCLLFSSWHSVPLRGHVISWLCIGIWPNKKHIKECFVVSYFSRAQVACPYTCIEITGQCLTMMKASARVVNMDKAEPLQGGSDAFSKVPSPRDHFSHLRGVAAKFSAPLRVAAPCAGTGNAIRAAFEIFGEENVIPMHVFDTDKHLAGPVG